MRTLVLSLVAGLLLACTPARTRTAETPAAFASAVYTTVPTASPVATPDPCAVDLAARTGLITQLQRALSTRDEAALRVTLNAEVLWARWERNQAGSLFPVDHENLSRMLAAPALSPAAIVQAGVTNESTATGVLMTGWASRELVVDVRPVDAPAGPPKLEPRSLESDAVVLVFAKCGHPFSQSGLFFGLAPGDGWTKVADLPSVTSMRQPSLAIPPRGWDSPPPTGVTLIDGVVDALARRDVPGLARYVTGRSVPCSTLVVCPSGVPLGTTVNAVSEGGGCEAGVPLTLVDNPEAAARTTTRPALAERMLAIPTTGRLLGVWEARTATIDATKYRYSS